MNHKGYTLVEMLLVLSVIMVMLIMTIPFVNQKPTWPSLVKDEISLAIEKTRQDAILSQKRMALNFEWNQISTTYDCLYKHPNLLFITPKTIYFNELGHIINPQTIYFKINQQKYALVFNLGYGAYHVQKA